MAEAEATVAVLDGLIIAGGGDIDPAIYGAAKHPQTEATVPDRDSWELAIAEACVRQGVPLLGICRGAQMLNVACGGTLHQHIPDLVGHDAHSGPVDGFGTHKVRVTTGTIIASILPGGEFFEVPTHHHQAVDIGAPADPGRVGGRRHHRGHRVHHARRFLVGVQRHPEQGTDPRLFRALVTAAEMHYSERTVSSLPPLLAGA